MIRLDGRLKEVGADMGPLMVILFNLIVYIPVSNLSFRSGQVFLGGTGTKQGLVYLAANGHNLILMISYNMQSNLKFCYDVINVMLLSDDVTYQFVLSSVVSKDMLLALSVLCLFVELTSCSRTQCSDASEARPRGPSVSS